MSKPTLSECLRAIAEHENNEEMPNWRRALHDAADALDAHPAPAAHAPGEALRSPDGAKGGVTEAGWRGAYAAMIPTLMEAQQDRDSLRAKLAEAERELAMVRSNWDGTIDSLGQAAIERDAARAEAERLRGERDANANARAMMIEVGHALLGCDGYPCRVESGGFTNTDLLNEIKRLKSHEMNCEAEEALCEMALLAEERKIEIASLAKEIESLRSAPAISVTDSEKLVRLVGEKVDAWVEPNDTQHVMKRKCADAIRQSFQEASRPADVEAVAKAIEENEAHARRCDAEGAALVRAHAALRALGVREAKPVDREGAWKAPWFSYSTLESFDVHTTAEAARAKAQESLDWCRDQASDGWPEEVTSICWGRVYGEVQETERRKRTDEDVNVVAACEEIVQYALLEDPALAHLGLAARGGEKASPAPASPGAGCLREIAADALNALPNIDPYDDDAHLVDVVVDDPRFESTVRRVAPRFCKVKLPEWGGSELTNSALGYRKALEDVRSSLRSQGFEVEAGGGT